MSTSAAKRIGTTHSPRPAPRRRRRRRPSGGGTSASSADARGGGFVGFSSGEHAAHVDHARQHMAGAVARSTVSGSTEARLTRAGGLAACGVLDVRHVRQLVRRAVGRVRVTVQSVHGSACAAVGTSRAERAGEWVLNR